MCTTYLGCDEIVVAIGIYDHVQDGVLHFWDTIHALALQNNSISDFVAA